MEATLDDVEKQIAAELVPALESLVEAGNMTCDAWTRCVNKILCKIGHARSYGVSAARCEGADTGGWL